MNVLSPILNLSDITGSIMYVFKLTFLDPLPDLLLDLSVPLPDAEPFLELALEDALEPDALDFDEAREAREALEDALDERLLARDERLLARDEARELARELALDP